MEMIPGSSMVEHSAVNRRVASSNLARGAKSLFVNHLKLSAVGLEPKACSYAFVCRLSYLLPPKSNADCISTFLLRFRFIVNRPERLTKICQFFTQHLAIKQDPEQIQVRFSTHEQFVRLKHLVNAERHHA